MKLALAFAIMGLCLSSIGAKAQQVPQTPPWKAAADRYYQRAAECWKRYENRQIRSFTAATDCADHDVVASLDFTHFRYPDIVRWMVAQHAAIADRVDRHEITPTEGRALWADVEVRMGTEIRQRDAIYARQAESAHSASEAEAEREALMQHLEAQREATAADEADAAQRAALLRLGAGLLAPTQTGSFGESIGNGANSYLGVPPATDTQIYCRPNGYGGGTVCDMH